MKREYSTNCPECDTTVWVYGASKDERAVFLEGWDAAVEYLKGKSSIATREDDLT